MTGHHAALVAIIPRGTAGPIVGRWPLRIVDPPFPVPPFEVRLHWQARDRETAAQVWFRRAILAALGSAAQQPEPPA